MSRRFFFQSDPAHPPETDDSVVLDSREAHHLIHVMRAKTGDRLQLFDGSGYQFESEIMAIGRSEVTVRLLSKEMVNRELEVPLVVAIPFPKADRQKFLVEKLTEIGVTSLLFLKTSRSAEQGNPKTISKLQQIVIEASKQCGRNRLMQISGPEELKQLVEAPANLGLENMDCFFAHPETSADPIAPSGPVKAGGRLVVIGPEGGLAPQELELLQKNNWHPLNLGKAILRMETAALVSATLLRE